MQRTLRQTDHCGDGVLQPQLVAVGSAITAQLTSGPHIGLVLLWRLVVHPPYEDAGRVKPIEFELQRTIRAPIEQVFARLVDIEGHNDWMADTGSMLKHTRQTSPGQPAVGTTFVDETSQGAMPGEIAELEAPHTIVYHWWEKSKSGKLKFEGWPSYHLQPSGDGETLVRHRAKLLSYGVWRLGTPIWRRFAVKERTITVDALTASFERPSSAPE
jgi:uncharacterized protein YndB with AHSA1/START domain